MSHICRYGWNRTIDIHFIRMELYPWVTYPSCRDRECRTPRFLVPNQASHPATISRIFVCGEQGNRTLTGFTRNILAGCHYKPILDYSPFCRISLNLRCWYHYTPSIFLSAIFLCPQEDSNPYPQVRSLMFYPLNYGDNFGRPENYTIKIGFPIIFSFLVLPPI